MRLAFGAQNAHEAFNSTHPLEGSAILHYLPHELFATLWSAPFGVVCSNIWVLHIKSASFHSHYPAHYSASMSIQVNSLEAVQDKSGSFRRVAIAFIIIPTIATAVRFWSRAVAHRGHFGLDDWTCLLAWVLTDRISGDLARS